LNSSFRPVFLSPSEDVPYPAKPGNLRLELRLPQVYDIPKTDEQGKRNAILLLKLEKIREYIYHYSNICAKLWYIS